MSAGLCIVAEMHSNTVQKYGFSVEDIVFIHYLQVCKTSIKKDPLSWINRCEVEMDKISVGTLPVCRVVLSTGYLGTVFVLRRFI